MLKKEISIRKSKIQFLSVSVSSILLCLISVKRAFSCVEALFLIYYRSSFHDIYYKVNGEKEIPRKYLGATRMRSIAVVTLQELVYSQLFDLLDGYCDKLVMGVFL